MYNVDIGDVPISFGIRLIALSRSIFLSFLEKAIRRGKVVPIEEGMPVDLVVCL